MDCATIQSLYSSLEFKYYPFYPDISKAMSYQRTLKPGTTIKKSSLSGL
jgi:hypothetical protein